MAVALSQTCRHAVGAPTSGQRTALPTRRTGSEKAPRQARLPIAASNVQVVGLPHPGQPFTQVLAAQAERQATKAAPVVETGAANEAGHGATTLLS